MLPTAKNDRFSIQPYLQRRWTKLGRKLAFNANDDEGLKIWRQQVSATLRQITGYDSMELSPLNPAVTEMIDLGDHIRQHVTIETEPGVMMPMYVLIPKTGKTAYPAVIAPHGHGSAGKSAVAGINDHPEISQTIENYNYDYGVQLVRNGFITFCPDARGFGQRLERFDDDHILNSSCRTINNMAFPLGQTVTGMWTWDLHRLVDYVQTRDDCLSDRIGCAGLSGGGLQTLWAAALDERIRCAVISGYMYGYKEALLDTPIHCSCNFVPHLYEHVDMGDIAALIAPRPLLIETGDQDPLNGASALDNVLSQVAIAEKAYRVLGSSEKLNHYVFKGGHRWDGTKAIPWLKQYLQD